MPTRKQILANRRNAQLSTGPRTPEGKSISRLNALRHGLTGQIDVRTPEDQQAHDEFCTAIIASLRPEGAIEHQFAQSIADDHWRLNRARALENNIFAITADLQHSDDDTQPSDLDTAFAHARTYIADPSRLNLLSLYERRIHGNMTRSLKQLTDLQTARRKAEAEATARRQQALEEETLLAQLAEAEGIQYLPPQNGFAFSPAEIHRNLRLALAKKHLQTTPQPHPNRQAHRTRSESVVREVQQAA